MAYLKGKIIGLGLMMFLGWMVTLTQGHQGNVAANIPAQSPTPTATKAASVGPQPTAKQSSGISGCTWWDQIGKNDLGKTICVQGIAKSISGNTKESPTLRIYFTNAPAEFYLADELHYYPNLKIGTCVYTTGRVGITNDGILFMRIVDLDSCE
jgi:hypothetical protein